MGTKRLPFKNQRIKNVKVFSTCMPPPKQFSKSQRKARPMHLPAFIRSLSGINCILLPELYTHGKLQGNLSLL